MGSIFGRKPKRLRPPPVPAPPPIPAVDEETKEETMRQALRRSGRRKTILTGAFAPRVTL